MKSYNIDNFYIEIYVQEKKIVDILGGAPVEYHPTSIIIYYKFLGKKIKIYEINKTRYHFIDDYEFNRVKLYSLLPLYIDDINTYKHNIIIEWNEVRTIHSKIYYKITIINGFLNKIKRKFSFTKKDKLSNYDFGY